MYVCSNLIYLYGYGHIVFCSTEKPLNMTIPITAAVIVIAVVLMAVTGFIVYKKKCGKRGKVAQI